MKVLMRRLAVSATVVGLLAACTGGSDTAESSIAPIDVTTTPAVEGTTAPPTTLEVTTTSTLEVTTTSSLQPVGLSAVTLVDDDREILSPVPSVVGPDGRLMVAYVTPEGELRLFRCADPSCSEPGSEVILGSPGEPASVDMALHPDGSPVVVVQSWSYDIAVVYSCSDPECESVETSELGDPEPCVYSDETPCQFTVDYPSIIVGSDGLPRVIYLTNTNPRSLKVATCLTKTCDGWEWATIDQFPPNTGSGPPSVRVDSQDRLIVAYWYDMPPDAATTSRVAICENTSCLDPPDILTIEGSVIAQTTPGPDADEFLVWHRTGALSLPVATADGDFAALWSEYSDYLVSVCTTEGCSDPVHVEVAEDWLLAKSAGALQLYTANDRSTGVFFNHASRIERTPQLHITTCADMTCTEGVTRALGLDTIIQGNFDVIISPDTAPRIVYTSTEGGIHLYTCTTQTCTP